MWGLFTARRDCSLCARRWDRQLLQDGKQEFSQSSANPVGDLDNDRLKVSAVNLAFFFWLLILEQCIFLSSSCHNDQTLAVVLVFCSTEKTLTIGVVLQWSKAGWDFGDLQSIFFLVDTLTKIQSWTEMYRCLLNCIPTLWCNELLLLSQQNQSSVWMENAHLTCPFAQDLVWSSPQYVNKKLQRTWWQAEYAFGSEFQSLYITLYMSICSGWQY